MSAPAAEGGAGCVALDFDGTVVTCDARQVGLARMLAERLGVTCLDAGAFWTLKRDGLTTRAALDRLGVAESDAAAITAAWQADIESPEWLARDEVLPGARDAIATLRSAGFAVLLLTARREPDMLRAQLRQLGLDSMFDVVVTVSPATAEVEKAAALTAYGARGLIGDSETDARAAMAAAIAFVGVSTGQRSAAFLAREGVAVVCDNITAAAGALRMTLQGSGESRPAPHAAGAQPAPSSRPHLRDP